MAYDPNLDKYVFSRSWENESERLTVSVRSYNQGRSKLQITRQNINNAGEVRFVKLGRLTKEEVESILPIIQEALNYMD